MEIQLMLLQCLTTSILCLGVHLAFSEGMIFYKLGRFIHEIIWVIIGCLLYYFISPQKAVDKADRYTSYLVKPIYDCLICMSSVWTIIVGHYFFVWGDWTNFVFPILIVCGFNVILDTFILGFRNGNIGL